MFISSSTIAFILSVNMMLNISLPINADMLQNISLQKSAQPTLAAEEIVELPASDVSAAQKADVPAPSSTENDAILNDTVVTTLSKLVYGEAGGVRSDMEKAAVVWCVLNRVDAGYGSIMAVATNRDMFNGYSPKHPVRADISALVTDVLVRYTAEKAGATNVGRVLPKNYLWFIGSNGHNVFRNAYRAPYSTWNWSLPNPYAT